MTITKGLIYWWTRLNGINNFLEFIMVVSFIAVIAFMIVAIVNRIDYESHDGSNLYESEFKLYCMFKRLACVSATVFTLSLGGVIFVPSQKDMAMIVVLPSIANSDALKTVVDDTSEIYRIAVDALKDSIKDAGVKK